MDLLSKRRKAVVGLFISLGLLLLSHAATAQFKHKWQLEMAAGMALPLQGDYLVKNDYPDISLVGNMRPGLRLEGQLMRHLNQWASAGIGLASTKFSALKAPGEKKQKDVDLSTTGLSFNGRVYPLGKRYRLTPFLQANVAYTQVSIAHGNYTYHVDSLSRHSGNPDHPVLLHIKFSKPESSQQSAILGIGATAGAELLLGDAVGLNWQAGYQTHSTGHMELLQEDVAYWHFRFGMFIRMFKNKQLY